MHEKGKNAEYEKAAAEYLTAFIVHLYNKGYNGFQVCEKLDADVQLVDKLIEDPRIVFGLEQRNIQFVEDLKKNSTDEEEFKKKLSEYNLHHYFDDHYYQHTSFIINLGPWQRKHKFTNAIDYHYKNNKKYTDNDSDVLAALCTPTTPADVQPYNLSHRELTPADRFYIVSDIRDGYTVKDISEKFNCSQLAVSNIAGEEGLAMPVTEDSIRTRIKQAITEGYSLQQITERFKHYDAEEIKGLIKTHRIANIARMRIDN